MATFEIENAARNALRDLTGHFLQLDAEMKAKIEIQSKAIGSLTKKTDGNTMICNKLTKQMEEIPLLNRLIRRSDIKIEDNEL